MFGLFGQVKMVFTIIMLLGLAGAGAYGGAALRRAGVVRAVAALAG